MGTAVLLLPSRGAWGEPSDELFKGQRIWLQPLGVVPDWQLACAGEAISTALGYTIQNLSLRALPSSAYFSPRKRYRAEKLLDFLETIELPKSAQRDTILGLTTRDISTTARGRKDWGVFGLGRLPGRAAVMSSHRLKPHGRGRAAVSLRGRWRHRLGVLAIHEIGHTLGLPHCNEHNHRCPMRDADGSIARADDSVWQLGPGCRARLEHVLGVR